MNTEFLIEKLETHWNQIETELGPKWPNFIARYNRIVATLDATDTDAFIGQMRDLMFSAPYTERLWKQWRAESTDNRISGGAEVLSLSYGASHVQPVEQIINRYRDLAAATPPASPTPSAPNPAPSAGN